MKICNCGWSEDKHDFRHSYDGAVSVKEETDDYGKIFYIDASEYKSVIKSGKCKMPSCNSAKILHKKKEQITETNEIVFDEHKSKIFQVQFINHEFQEGEPYIVRYINFILPDETKCRTCGENLKEHNSMTHIFRALVYVEGKTDNDEVYISSADEKKIDWKPKN